MQYQLEHGDCLEVLRTLADSSVDAIVTDPPYGLSFMGKRWDYDVPGVEVWAECLRVLKPGGHLLAFAGTRTQHRMAVRIEDAGFEIRDMIAWVYGSGFPKSLDVSKAIDKVRDDSAEGAAVGQWLKAQREARGLKQKEVAALWPSATGGLTGCVANWEALGKVPKWDQWLKLKEFIGFGDDMDAEVWRLNGRKGQPGNERADREVSAPGSNDVYQPVQRVINAGTPVLAAAQQWQGWGTALKPALEPITMARKPLAGTVAANVLKHGTGALNIDGCRVGTSKDVPASVSRSASGNSLSGSADGTLRHETGLESGHNPNVGRWPANLIHDGSEDVVTCFPAKAGAEAPVRGTEKSAESDGRVTGERARVAGEFHGDNGNAARFFYCAKASRSDRNAGLASGSAPAVGTGATMREREDADWPARNGNHHPTVKPTDLMAYLCRLVTPPGGLVLDPFMGSGSTGKACMREGFRFLGIEREAEYLAIARARIDHEARRHGTLAAEPLPPETITAAPAPPARHAQRPEPEPAQRGLF